MGKTLLVTGGAGFIGSEFVLQALTNGASVIVLDKLTYAGRRKNLSKAEDFARREQLNFELVVGDINDATLVGKLLTIHRPTALINFAAESHVDNSIADPGAFIQTNIVGTYTLLQRSHSYFCSLSERERASFRYLQVSTDEVYGSLGSEGHFSENTPYAPNSPYSASKAAGDHLVRAWFHTYGLPTITTNCSNNYGPRQHEEKLIPLMITNAVQRKPLPVYGDGQNVRDWIHVSDHVAGVYLALTRGRPGETYCFGGNAEKTNLEVVHEICHILDQRLPLQARRSYAETIRLVNDRPGHDRRYAIDDGKAQTELGFTRKFSFSDGLRETVEWYIQDIAQGAQN
jgi:dTDP-glucose 4,6-dehydratase